MRVRNEGPLVRRALGGLGAITLLMSMGFEGSFEGCGGSSPPPARDLPTGEGIECVVTADCEPMTCQVATCAALACAYAPDVTDADSDGVVDMPCGSDCDPLRRDVRPGATELCDLRDNDCDGRVDEDAPVGELRAALPLRRRDRLASGVLGEHVVAVDALEGLAILTVNLRTLTSRRTNVLSGVTLVTYDAVVVDGVLRVFYTTSDDTGIASIDVSLDEAANVRSTMPATVLTDAPGSEHELRAVAGARAVALLYGDEGTTASLYVEGWTAPIAFTRPRDDLDAAITTTDVAVITNGGQITRYSLADGTQRDQLTISGAIAEHTLVAIADRLYFAIGVELTAVGDDGVETAIAVVPMGDAFRLDVIGDDLLWTTVSGGYVHRARATTAGVVDFLPSTMVSTTELVRHDAVEDVIVGTFAGSVGATIVTYGCLPPAT